MTNAEIEAEYPVGKASHWSHDIGYTHAREGARSAQF
jgi:hypothetical protein